MELLKQHLKSENLINHSLAVEAIRGIAERLDQDADKFGLAGLLHDIDYDHCRRFPPAFSAVAQILRKWFT